MEDKILTAERLVRLETKVDQVLDVLKDPPLSPLVKQELHKIEMRLLRHEEKHVGFEAFQDSVNQKIAWVAGVFAVIGAGGLTLVKAVFAYFQTGGPPNGP